MPRTRLIPFIALAALLSACAPTTPLFIAQVTTNVLNNVVPPAYVLMDLFRLSFRKSAVVVGLLAFCTFPWVLVKDESASGLQMFVQTYSAFLAEPQRQPHGRRTVQAKAARDAPGRVGDVGTARPRLGCAQGGVIGGCLQARQPVLQIGTVTGMPG